MQLNRRRIQHYQSVLYPPERHHPDVNNRSMSTWYWLLRFRYCKWQSFYHEPKLTTETPTGSYDCHLQTRNQIIFLETSPIRRRHLCEQCSAIYFHFMTGVIKRHTASVPRDP